MFDSTFDQAKAFSTSSSDDGSCVSVDAFYSPDVCCCFKQCGRYSEPSIVFLMKLTHQWYTDGKQYGYRPKAKTNGLSTRRTGASGGGWFNLSTVCSFVCCKSRIVFLKKNRHKVKPRVYFWDFFFCNG